jgi:hypothetical protein
VSFDTLGPISDTLFELSDILGPISDTLGPVSDTLGPVSDTLGPVSDTLGPVFSWFMTFLHAVLLCLFKLCFNVNVALHCWHWCDIV